MNKKKAIGIGIAVIVVAAALLFMFVPVDAFAGRMVRPVFVIHYADGTSRVVDSSKQTPFSIIKGHIMGFSSITDESGTEISDVEFQLKAKADVPDNIQKVSWSVKALRSEGYGITIYTLDDNYRPQASIYSRDAVDTGNILTTSAFNDLKNGRYVLTYDKKFTEQDLIQICESNNVADNQLIQVEIVIPGWNGKTGSYGRGFWMSAYDGSQWISDGETYDISASAILVYHSNGGSGGTFSIVAVTFDAYVHTGG